MAYKNDLTAAYVRSILDYDPDTGILRWLVQKHHDLAGKVAGTVGSSGHRTILIDGSRYKAHRIIWLYMTGVWPKDEVDHENLAHDDNRWKNLREATHAENMRNRSKYKNNSCGIKGIHWCKFSNKWHAQIRENGKKINLGYRDNRDDAAALYAEAALKRHGNFGRIS